VEFGLRMYGVNRKERRAKARDMIELVSLSGFENHYPGELSDGMRQRVAIARTLVMNPEIILMDEPFGALDEQTRLILGEELLRIWEKIRATILFITHDIDEAVFLGNRIYVMTARPGRIKTLIPVPLGRPRYYEMVLSTAFNETKARIFELIKEETKTFMNRIEN
jgi:ABC-type nitrate/sulfonate/bicarbonate transport system ATPase subunit